MVRFESSLERKPNIFEDDTMDDVSSSKISFEVSTSAKRDE